MPDCPRCGELVQGLATDNKLYEEMSDELAKRYRRIQQLEAALKTYGRHTNCTRINPEAMGIPCLCGLADALRGTSDG